jgi:hypothetical protein
VMAKKSPRDDLATQIRAPKHLPPTVAKIPKQPE